MLWLTISCDIWLCSLRTELNNRFVGGKHKVKSRALLALIHSLQSLREFSDVLACSMNLISAFLQVQAHD